MPKYNLLEYCDNYSVTSGSFWDYYRDKVNDNVNKNDTDNNKINNSKTRTKKYFEYKTKVIGSTPNSDSRLNAEVLMSLKCLGNF